MQVFTGRPSRNSPAQTLEMILKNLEQTRTRSSPGKALGTVRELLESSLGATWEKLSERGPMESSTLRKGSKKTNQKMARCFAVWDPEQRFPNPFSMDLGLQKPPFARRRKSRPAMQIQMSDSIFSCKNRSREITKKCTFSGAPKYRPTILFHKRK